VDVHKGTSILKFVKEFNKTLRRLVSLHSDTNHKKLTDLFLMKNAVLSSKQFTGPEPSDKNIEVKFITCTQHQVGPL